MLMILVMLCFLVWGIYLLTSKNARALQRKENMCFKDAESENATSPFC
jgi:hypothetical protein